MGKLLVKLGLWMQAYWCKLMCKWNWLVSKLIVNVKDCPIAECVCKNKQMPGTKIGASVAAKPKRIKSKKNPYTQKQYDQVLAFFQENAGNFYTVNEVDEGAEVGNEGTTQAIIDAQVADSKTGVRQDPKSGKYGIPKKKK